MWLFNIIHSITRQGNLNRYTYYRYAYSDMVMEVQIKTIPLLVILNVLKCSDIIKMLLKAASHHEPDNENRELVTTLVSRICTA